MLIDSLLRSAVLLLEDDLITALDVQHMLERFGVKEVVHAVSQRAALDFIDKRAIDFALIDFTLREGNSSAVAQALSQRTIPFVFATGHELSDLPREFAEVPLLRKPFVEEDIWVAIKKMCNSFTP